MGGPTIILWTLGETAYIPLSMFVYLFSSTVFCRAAIVHFSKPIRLKDFSRSLGTESSAPITTGTTIAADNHICWTLIHKSVYLSFFSIAFCLTRQSPGIAASMNLTVLDDLSTNVISGWLWATGPSANILKSYRSIQAAIDKTEAGLWSHHRPTTIILSQLPVY